MRGLQETMGSVIRRERRARSLTIKALAAQTMLSVVYLGEIERGRKYPSAGVLERIAQALEIGIADLLELVADELRGEAENQPADAIGFMLPTRGGMAPQMTIKRIVPMLDPEEVTTMAELGAFFLSRKSGNSPDRTIE